MGKASRERGYHSSVLKVIGELARSRPRAMGNAAGGCMDRDLAEATEQELL